MGLRTLVAIIGVLIALSFLVSAWSLRLVVQERDARIRENTTHAMENERRGERNCERVNVIVELLNSLTPNIDLNARLAEIDRRYPDVKPCQPKGR